MIAVVYVPDVRRLPKGSKSALTIAHDVLVVVFENDRVDERNPFSRFAKDNDLLADTHRVGRTHKAGPAFQTAGP